MKHNIKYTVKTVCPEDVMYGSVSGFIQDIFANSYNANITVDYPQLISLWDMEGVLKAALGVRGTRQGQLFVEQYDVRPAEDILQDMVPVNVDRSDIAEVGNLAAVETGWAAYLYLETLAYLKQNQYEAILFTGNHRLVRSFKSMGLAPVSLSKANPELLSDKGRSWGTYYDHIPYVSYGHVCDSYDVLKSYLNHLQKKEMRCA